MSRSVEIDTQIATEIALADIELQEIYKQVGGKGNVIDFLNKGATSPRTDAKNNWETMSPKEQQLWLDLHETGLPLLGLDLIRF